MRAFTGAIKELEEYVRTYHTTGLAWNPDVCIIVSTHTCTHTHNWKCNIN